jgi:hypothetical protein
MTSDPRSDLPFYEQVIGWNAQKWPDPSMDYTLLMAGETAVAGVIPTPPGHDDVKTQWYAYVAVPDVDETLAQAESLGGSVLVPARDIPDIGRFGMILDPQGVPFAVITSCRPAMEETDPRLLEPSWHELHTTDWKAAIRFYEALFGWEKKGEVDMGPMGVYYIFGLGRFMYGGMYDAPPGTPSQWLTYVRVDSADAAAERAKAAGGRIVHGPAEVSGGSRIAMILDPKGAMFGVQSNPQV